MPVKKLENDQTKNLQFSKQSKKLTHLCASFNPKNAFSPQEEESYRSLFFQTIYTDF
jgi:hypothetical protein